MEPLSPSFKIFSTNEQRYRGTSSLKKWNIGPTKPDIGPSKPKSVDDKYCGKSKR